MTSSAHVRPALLSRPKIERDVRMVQLGQELRLALEAREAS